MRYTNKDYWICDELKKLDGCEFVGFVENELDALCKHFNLELSTEGASNVSESMYYEIDLGEETIGIRVSTHRNSAGSVSFCDHVFNVCDAGDAQNMIIDVEDLIVKAAQ